MTNRTVGKQTRCKNWTPRCKGSEALTHQVLRAHALPRHVSSSNGGASLPSLCSRLFFLWPYHIKLFHMQRHQQKHLLLLCTLLSDCALPAFTCVFNIMTSIWQCSRLNRALNVVTSLYCYNKRTRKPVICLNVTTNLKMEKVLCFVVVNRVPHLRLLSAQLCRRRCNTS